MKTHRNGVSTNGVTANLAFFGRGTFWVPLCQHLSFVCVPFPQSVKIHYFCSNPISVDPICPHPRCSTPAPSATSRSRRSTRIWIPSSRGRSVARRSPSWSAAAWPSRRVRPRDIPDKKFIFQRMKPQPHNKCRFSSNIVFRGPAGG